MASAQTKVSRGPQNITGKVLKDAPKIPMKVIGDNEEVRSGTSKDTTLKISGNFRKGKK